MCRVQVVTSSQLVWIITYVSGQVNRSSLKAAPPSGGYAASSGSTPLRGASGMVGTGAYSAGSKMPTVLSAPAPTESLR